MLLIPCVLYYRRKDIHISRDMFKNEEAPPFFIYDIVDETLSTKYLSADMQEKVNEKKDKKI